jgi:hypothetical protein
MVVIALAASSILVRWQMADFSDWGIDEAANLWLGSEILAGRDVPTGLISSRGIPNLSGAPWTAAPLALLPDLLTVSRVLSILHMAALAVLGFSLSKRGGSHILIASFLLFSPGLLMTSPSLWNQYLTIPLTALLLPLMLFLADGRPDPSARAVALAAATFLILLLPAVHLAAFVDLAAGVVLLMAVLWLRRCRVHPVIAGPGLLMAAVAVSPIYDPWLLRMTGSAAQEVLWWPVPISVFVAASISPLIPHFLQTTFDRAALAARRSTILPWICLVVMASIVVIGAALPFRGAQAAARLLDHGEPTGRLLLAAHVGMVVSLAPLIGRVYLLCRQGIDASVLADRLFRSRPGTAAVLVAYPYMLIAGRFVLEPAILLPGGRSDLLLPLLPALLAPLLAIDRAAIPRATIWGVGVSTAVAAGAFGWLSAVGASAGYRAAVDQPVPPSEIGEVVDWVAARHHASGGGAVIDLGYDLERGREWINEIACSPASTPWYSIGRPYDWMLRRRHGLTNSREGDCRRRGGTGLQLGYRREAGTPPGMVVVFTTNALEVRSPE